MSHSPVPAPPPPPSKTSCAPPSSSSGTHFRSGPPSSLCLHVASEWLAESRRGGIVWLSAYAPPSPPKLPTTTSTKLPTTTSTPSVADAAFAAARSHPDISNRCLLPVPRLRALMVRRSCRRSMQSDDKLMRLASERQPQPPCRSVCKNFFQRATRRRQPCALHRGSHGPQRRHQG